ncbi:Ig-like domain-containing protein [Maricaulis sp.]|uniref:Ig-like domain-containing protein n=1 Tax=Maricaulis sp. TaxID=1486257 RepID=UPI003A8CF234
MSNLLGVDLGGQMRVLTRFGGGAAVCAALLVTTSPSLAQTAVCYSYDGTGRLVEAAYSDGSQIAYDLDRNDNRNGTAQTPTGATTCATPTAAIGPLPGGDLSIGSGASPPPPPPPANNPPVAVADGAAVQRFGTISVYVLNNDSDPDGDTLSISSITTPTLGTAVLTNGATVVQFTAGSTIGTADFSYTISDGNGGTATGYISIAIIGGGGGGGIEN